MKILVDLLGLLVLAWIFFILLFAWIGARAAEAREEPRCPHCGSLDISRTPGLTVCNDCPCTVDTRPSDCGRAGT